MICTILEAQKGFKIDNSGFFSHQEILIWHRTNTASCTQCMGPARDTAEQKRHDQTANYSNQVFFFKVPACISDIFGSCTGQCWWCLVQLPWKEVWWRQPQPVIWCGKLYNTELALCNSGWKDSWVQKTLPYQIYELLPGTWLALGPSCLRARQASSNSRFGRVAMPTSGALAGEALPATSHTLSQLSSTKLCWQEIPG